MIKKLITPSCLSVLALCHTAFAGEKFVPLVVEESIDSCAWHVGLEVLYLKAHQSGSEYNDSSESSSYGYGYGAYDSQGHEYGDQDYEFAYRVELAYKKENSLGLQLRYFNFEGSDTLNGLGSSFYPEIQAIDLEVFDTFNLGSAVGEYSIGVRYLSFKEKWMAIDVVDFTGYGPTAAVELVNGFGDSQFAVYANTRVSMLFGDDDANNLDNKSGYTAELGLGLQYSFGNCASNVRLGVEGQHYSGFSASHSEDTSLFGAVLGLNLNF